MIVRKINAVLGLLTTILIMDHAIFNAAWMLSDGSITKSADALPWVLVGLMATHAVISIGLLMFPAAEGKAAKMYPKNNIITIVQRISGMLLVVFTVLHVMGATGVMQPPAVINAIFPPLFYVVTLAHVAVSTSKAFVTLGVGNVKAIKIIDIAVKAICVATLVADIVGFYIHLC